uniref:F-box domain-containing protein n=1 Tax=Glycine max TaxID=3847 RepID=C6T3M2_SOYBN|nr:unknown [Glycine max]|eukprot:NP_001236414.1 uncharacterized protein LOC100527207 [Glycine max]
MELLPYDCFAHILSFTSTQDVCRSSLVSSIVQSMADSDAVWEKFLPLNHQEIVSRLVPPSLLCSSKKELFVKLCKPRPVDDGNKVKFYNVFLIFHVCCLSKDLNSHFLRKLVEKQKITFGMENL